MPQIHVQASSGCLVEQRQEAGYETPVEENECTSQVEKNDDSDDDDELDTAGNDTLNAAATDGSALDTSNAHTEDGTDKQTLAKSMIDASMTQDSIQFSQHHGKEYPTLYTEEEMQVVQLKNASLMAENKRLRTKLAKVKTQVETLTQKHNSVHDSLKAMEGKHAQTLEQNFALRNELDEIRRNQAKVDKSEVTEILARVKVAGIGYTLLLDSQGKTVWHQD